ncbi:hypothetical protein E4630_12090 [Aeromonas hydrophila]|uniref:hypothetical protein n=1 Tax=Aeromonas hydrophila TaxID=644 RepID=UPI00107ED0CB|nr:hypothetical protein [Aeromonas hydrophila]QBX71541.1 hypothetical protein E4625_12310 [Aeromonas hydrophila]QBX76241.1 hypothetical protein E4630_12090 [Aeromonas hydrophila]
MAGVNVFLSANTQKYLNEIKNAQNKSNTSFNKMGKDAQNMGNEITGAFDSPTAAINGFLSRLGPVGAGIGALGAVTVGLGAKLASMGKDAATAQRQLEALASSNNMSVDQMTRYGIAVQSVGLDIETFSDVLTDVGERVGEYASTNGGGPLADYFDTISGKVNTTIDDLKGLSNLDVLKKVQADLIESGASMQQQVFVLKSLSENAAKLPSVLSMSQQDINNMMQGYATDRARLSQQTMNDIDRTMNNMNMLSDNFNKALVEAFSGLIDLAGEMSRIGANFFNKIAADSRGQKIADEYASGKLKVNSKNSQDIIDAAPQLERRAMYEARQSATSKNVKESGLSSDEYIKKEYERRMQEMNKFFIDAADQQNAATIKGGNKGTSGVSAPMASNIEDAQKQYEALTKAAEKSNAEIGRLQTQLNVQVGDESKKALEERIKQEQEGLKVTEASLKATGAQISTFQSAAQAKALAETKKAAQMRSQALQATLKTELDIENFAHQEQLAKLKDFVDQGALTQSEYQTAIEVAEQKHQERLIKIQENAANEKKRLADQEYQDRLRAMNLIKTFSTDVEQQANQDLLIKRAQIEREYELDQEKGANAILNEQDKNNKLAEIDRQYESEKIERENQNMMDRDVAKLDQATREREVLIAQYEQGVIDKQEFDRQIIESDEKVNAATRDLAMARLGSISEVFKGASQLAKEGSKQAKIMFGLEKASTIASMSLSMYEQWGKAATWSEKAMVMASFVPQIASATAVTLGQFHDGTDYVEGTGSYYLQQGERVVNTDTNKDLTSYLENNKKGGGSTSIDASINITGNTIDESFEPKFKQMCFDQMETIYDAFNQHKANIGG